MSENKKPRLCEVLGVEVGERFRHFGNEADIWINNDGDPCTDTRGYTSQDIVWEVIDIINHPEALIRKPRLTEPELAICKAVGAKWVSWDRQEREYIPKTVFMWEKEPIEGEDGEYFDFDEEEPLAEVSARLFPSLKPGCCIKAER